MSENATGVAEKGADPQALVEDLQRKLAKADLELAKARTEIQRVEGDNQRLAQANQRLARENFELRQSLTRWRAGSAVLGVLHLLRR